MTIKNETAFTKECMEGAMRASNFDNSRYKTFKLIYNMFGLIFGMMMIRELVLKMTGNGQADTFMIVLFGLVAVVFLYIGMIGMDKSNKKKFHNIYGKMVGIKFTYEIDAENIIITDEENDSDTFSWNEVVKWNQDPDNIYLFVGDDNCLVVSKKGFTQGSADDLRQLADAVIGMRNEAGNEPQEKQEIKTEEAGEDKIKQKHQ
uniref:YcxB family protein n=1 Tax=Lachnospira eligens TaxID=39485 RepID=UPI0040255D85